MLEQERHDEALTAFERDIQLDSNSLAAQYNRGVLCGHLDSHTGSQTLFQALRRAEIRGAMQPVKVVIDTNILIASLFQGSSAALIDLWLEGRITLCLSGAVVREYLHVLRSFRFRGQRLSLVVEALEDRKNCLFVESPPQGRWVKEDPSDDKFVSCALALGARYIVSSDVHLKRLGQVEGTTVISSGDMLRIVAG